MTVAGFDKPLHILPFDLRGVKASARHGVPEERAEIGQTEFHCGIARRHRRFENTFEGRN
ncbi:MAG TPA: hypothetical protein VML19_22375 [Verrucomicrobiae bacterium]|nr:hypothetical protein [Verrucomicrobiae bacterium]